MWSVLRRLQGEEYTDNIEERGIEKNLNHITRHSCKVVSTGREGSQKSLTEPYRSILYPKLVETIDAPEVGLREKALESLLGIFGQKQDHVLRCVTYGVIPPLIRRLKDETTYARASAGKALMFVAVTQPGLECLIENNYTTQLLEALDDPDPPVVVEVLACLAAMDHAVTEYRGTETLIKQGCIKIYIQKAKAGPPAVTTHSLIALGKVFNVKGAFMEVLNENVLPVLKVLVRSAHSGVKEQACEVLCKIAFYNAGKTACADQNVLESLLDFVEHDEESIQVSGTGAIMITTVSNEGKRQAFSTGICQATFNIVEKFSPETTNPVLLTNCLKIICNCSDTPPARLLFRPLCPVFQKIQKHYETTNQLLSRTAKRAELLSSWKPGDPNVIT
eukprot:TRINITY_DN21256_c0_g1_i1.p1 TRINITY_DN21256_c0_g1~~TRINITY_DN21256_c0_g1_i1.p1  ORF type:complete len:406 (+),score=53.29 TRINITY_DN21256_c0_g1_i1:48-1220(+)